MPTGGLAATTDSSPRRPVSKYRMSALSGAAFSYQGGAWGHIKLINFQADNSDNPVNVRRLAQ